MRKWSEEFEMDKLVSIIIPVYNVEMYLAECIESVLKQTYQNLEILLIDDGSTDNSGKICDEYAKKDKRIKIIHKENGGVSSARNKGLDIAQGEYITFIDADDFVAENYVQALYKNLKENDSDLSFCKYSYFKDNNFKPCKEIFPNKIIVNKASKEFLDFLTRFISYKNNFMGSSCRILSRKENIGTIRFNQEVKIAEDLLFVLKIILNADSLSFAKECLYFYRVNHQSASYTYKKDYLINQLVLYKEIKSIYQFLKDRKINRLLNIYGANLCHSSFSNEIKFKQKNRRNNIKEIRKSELYKYYNLKNIFGQGKIFVVVKFLVVWFLVKMRLV